MCHGCIEHTSRNGSQDCEPPLLGVAMVSVDEITDECVEQDHEDSSESRHEEKRLLLAGVFLGCITARKADDVQHRKSRNSHSRIQV